MASRSRGTRRGSCGETDNGEPPTTSAPDLHRGRRAGVGRAGGGYDARRLLPHRQREGRAFQPRPRADRAAPVGREPRAPARRHEPRQVFLRSSRRGQRRADLLARLQLHLRRVGDHRRGQGHAPHVRRIAAVPCARQARAYHRQQARREERVSRDLDLHDRSGRQVRREGHHARRRRADPDSPGRGSHREARPADPRRRLHVARARQVRTRRAPAHGGVLRDRALQGAQGRHQRVGPRAAVRAVRHLAAVAGHPPAHAGRRHLRRVRLGALHPDVRQPRVPRHRRPTRRTTWSRS